MHLYVFFIRLFPSASWLDRTARGVQANYYWLVQGVRFPASAEASRRFFHGSRVCLLKMMVARRRDMALEVIGITLEFIGIHWNCIGIHWKSIGIHWK